LIVASALGWAGVENEAGKARRARSASNDFVGVEHKRSARVFVRQTTCLRLYYERMADGDIRTYEVTFCSRVQSGQIHF